MPYQGPDRRRGSKPDERIADALEVLVELLPEKGIYGILAAQFEALLVRLAHLEHHNAALMLVLGKIAAALENGGGNPGGGGNAAILDRLNAIFTQGEQIMAGEKELGERIKALKETLSPKLDEAVSGINAAVADIGKIHDLLDANQGTGTDVAGANAALDELEAKFTGVAETLAALKTQVDRPEPGDTPPPTP